MNLKYARYIMEVAKQRNITTAAQNMYISQPSLSQIISKTEKDLNTKLFDRTPNGLILTTAGKLYIDAMENAMLIDQNLRRKLNECNKSENPCLRIGVSTQRVLNALPHILPDLIQKYPDISFSFHSYSSSILEEMVLNGSIDIALAMTFPHSEGLEYMLLEKEKVILYAGENTEFARSHRCGSTINISEAKRENFISMSPGHNSRLIQDRLFFAHDISPFILAECNEMQIGKELVNSLNAVMICLLSYLLASDDRRYEGTYYFVNHVTCERNLYAVYRKNIYITSYMSEFISIMEEYFGTALPSSEER